MSLRTIVTGTAMMSSVRVLRLLAQFIAIPILARLLSPEDYGVVAIAMPFVLFAMMLADAGIGMSLLRAPLSDRRAWSGCFWLTTFLGIAFAAFMGLLAGPMAGLFDEPALRPIIGALAIAVVMQGLQLIPVHVMDLARAHVLAIEALMRGAPSAAYNLGNGIGTSIGQVLASFKKLGLPLPYSHTPRRAGDPSRLVADIMAAKRGLGWQPEHREIEIIIRSAYDWHQSNHALKHAS